MKFLQLLLSVLVVVFIPAVLSLGQQPSPFAAAIPDWQVTSAKPVSLLLAFDTDSSLNRMGYNKFYDHDVAEFFPQSQCRYQTLMWTRSADSVRLAASLPIVACPRKRGFLYAGFAGYSKAPHPGKPEEWCGQHCPPAFADCSDVWQASNAQEIGQAIADRQLKLASGTCGTTDKDGSNITEDWRISFVTPRVLAQQSFTAAITGGAAYFRAAEDDFESNPETGSVMHLSGLIPANTVNRVFRSYFHQHDLNVTWGMPEEYLDQLDFAQYAGFTLEDVGGAIHLIGLHSAAGNGDREFLSNVDLGLAPSSLVSYPDSGLDFSRFKQIDPQTMAVFTSPDRGTVFVLTASRIIVLDVRTKHELFNSSHDLRFNKIIMAEWAEGENTARWETQLNSVISQIPKPLFCRH
jgi:hypothetical protein